MLVEGRHRQSGSLWIHWDFKGVVIILILRIQWIEHPFSITFEVVECTRPGPGWKLFECVDTQARLYKLCKSEIEERGTTKSARPRRRLFKLQGRKREDLVPNECLIRRFTSRKFL